MGYEKCFIYDLDYDCFDRHLTPDQATALHDVLSNLNLRHLALFATSPTHAMLAAQGVQKICDWLLIRSLENIQRLANEPPNDE